MPHLGEQTLLSRDPKESTVSGSGGTEAGIHAPHAHEDTFACSNRPPLNCGQDKCTDTDRPTDAAFVTAAFVTLQPRQNAEQ